MREFRDRKRLKRRLYSWPVLMLILILLILVIQGTWKIYQKERESRANLQRVTSQLANLNERNTSLSNDISKLKTEGGVEDEIRSKYEVSKEGEEVVVIIDKNGLAATSTEKHGLSLWWQNFLNLFRR